jgi:hypothetical protein
MDSWEGLRVSDPAVAARYLQLRSHFHDRLLAQVERHVTEHYQVQPARRIPPTLVAVTRSGFVRSGEGEMWPVVFMTAVDITLALCVQISAERLAILGTMLNGPQRLRHRGWEDWWGWETGLAGAHERFFSLTPTEQDDAMLGWYMAGLEWLAHSGLLPKKS